MTIERMKIQPNTFVSLDYSLRDGDGNLLDSSDGEGGEPIDYIHGYGMLVPGLEAKLVGLATGDERELVVAAEDGYGEHDDDLVITVDRAQFPNPRKIKPGDEFLAEAPDGDELPMRVVEVRGDAVLVDANHPLAGLALHYKVKILVVRPATEEEILTAARELAEAEEHVHGPECDHDDSPLVGLGPKKRLVN